jgi:prolyl oligopeptidase
MQQLMKQPRAGVSFKRAGHYFVSRNNGTQNQDVTYVAWSLEELLAGGRVLVDPNTFSADGTSSLTSLTVSGDGQLVAYGVSEAAATDDISVPEPGQRRPGGGRADPDQVLSGGMAARPSLLRTPILIMRAGWYPNGRALRTPKLRVHRIGDSQDHDELILEFPGNDQLIFWAEVTDDDRYLVVSIVEGHREQETDCGPIRSSPETQ